MNRRFKLILGSISFFAGMLLMVFCLSHFISTLLMLIGVIFILNVLIERKIVFLITSIILIRSSKLNSKCIFFNIYF